VKVLRASDHAEFDGDPYGHAVVAVTSALDVLGDHVPAGALRDKVRELMAVRGLDAAIVFRS
jgi:hypothetical protein